MLHRLMSDDSGVFNLAYVAAVTPDHDDSGLAVLQLVGGQSVKTHTPYSVVKMLFEDHVTCNMVSESIDAGKACEKLEAEFPPSPTLDTRDHEAS